MNDSDLGLGLTSRLILSLVAWRMGSVSIRNVSYTCKEGMEVIARLLADNNFYKQRVEHALNRELDMLHSLLGRA